MKFLIIFPEEGFKTPAIIFKSVDFPAQFIQIILNISQVDTLKFISFKI
ncbi:MAG: hypothetical protein LBC61_00350 [Candidatus Peribacteria bacterium]|nr:hypothetical protein [Candidatus Peribacteria bacterium]